MSATYDHGPLRPYRVIWKSGYVEEILAHQVLVPSVIPSLFGDPQTARRLLIHGEINGHWQLILDADYDEVSSVRLLAGSEDLA